VNLRLWNGEADAYIRATPESNRLAAWRALRNARTTRSATGLPSQLLRPTFLASQDPRVDGRLWNGEARQCTLRASEDVPEVVKRSARQNLDAPTDMKERLIPNQCRLETASDVAAEIEEYCHALEESE